MARSAALWMGILLGACCVRPMPEGPHDDDGPCLSAADLRAVDASGTLAGDRAWLDKVDFWLMPFVLDLEDGVAQVRDGATPACVAMYADVEISFTGPFEDIRSLGLQGGARVRRGQPIASGYFPVARIPELARIAHVIEVRGPQPIEPQHASLL